MNKAIKKRNIIAVTIAALIIGAALGENAGWPFLEAPLEKQLSFWMNRQLRFVSNDAVNLSSPNTINNQANNKPLNAHLFRVNFLGGFNLRTSKLTIAAPTWSTKPYFLDGNDILLKLRYIDIWRAYRGQSLRIGACKLHS